MVGPDGWLRSGDLGLVDGDGNVVVVDRLKELIKVRGFQVAPAELEALLATHPAVADAAVPRRPDPAHGEVPVAVVVPRPGADPDPDELLAWVAERVAPPSGSAPSASPTPSPGRPRASCCAGPWDSGHASGLEGWVY
jgi:acyl-CoA synthetase (AMP-forming)/AMP-acid ligase II